MAAMVACGICGKAKARSGCKIIKPTLQEQKELNRVGDDRKEFIYCKPCWRILSDPLTGPSLGKGIIETRLRQAGVPNAEQVAKSFHKKLLARIVEAREKAKNKPS